MNKGCIRDTLTGICQHAASKTQVVFVQVDGRKVFAVCLLLIVACIVWMAMSAHKGQEDF